MKAVCAAVFALLLASCGTIESSEFQPVVSGLDTPHDSRGILVENRLDEFLADREGSREEILAELQTEALGIEAWLLTNSLFEGLRDQVQAVRIRVLHYAGEYPADAEARERARRDVRVAVARLREDLERAGRVPGE